MIEGEERAKPAPADEDSAVSFKLFNTASTTWKIGVALGISSPETVQNTSPFKERVGPDCFMGGQRVLKQNLCMP